jgi:hypothetical protein
MSRADVAAMSPAGVARRARLGTADVASRCRQALDLDLGTADVEPMSPGELDLDLGTADVEPMSPADVVRASVRAARLKCVGDGEDSVTGAVGSRRHVIRDCRLRESAI